jgi:hypothetical protein
MTKKQQNKETERADDLIFCTHISGLDLHRMEQ